jgi:hypothetical protein
MRYSSPSRLPASLSSVTLADVQAGEFIGQVSGVGEDVWQPTRGAGQRPVAVAQVVVQLHVAQRGKAVEPGVGHGFHGVDKAVFADALDELVALGAGPWRARLGLR